MIDEDKLLRIAAFADTEDCVDETAIEQRDLIAVARGETVAVAQAHLASCAYCRQLVESYREIESQRAPVTSRRTWSSAIAALAAAVIFTVAVIMAPQAPTADYELAAVDGLVARNMDEPAPASTRWRVATTSRVEFVLRPTTRGASAGAAGVFVRSPGGTYRRAEATSEAIVDDGATAFRIRVTGAQLLAGRGSERRVVLVVAANPSVLDDLRGATSITAGRADVLSAIRVDVEAVR